MGVLNSAMSIRRKLLVHVLSWVCYGLFAWLYNVFFRPETKFIQTFGTLPLLILAFYIGYSLIHMTFVKRQYFIGFVSGLGAGVALLVFGYFWVYQLMPKVGVNLFYYRASNEYELYLEVASSLLYRFSAYGVCLAFFEYFDLHRVLRCLLLAKQISPHHLRQIWSQLIFQIPIENPTLLSHVKGEIQLAEYSAQLPYFTGGIVTVDREMLELERLIRVYSGRDIVCRISGRSSGQRILPYSIIALFENALKYSDKKYPIKITVDYRSGVDFVIQNRIDPQGTNQAGLGTGLANLKERLTLVFHNKATLDTKHQDDLFIAKLNYKK